MIRLSSSSWVRGRHILVGHALARCGLAGLLVAEEADASGILPGEGRCRHGGPLTPPRPTAIEDADARLDVTGIAMLDLRSAVPAVCIPVDGLFAALQASVGGLDC